MGKKMRLQETEFGYLFPEVLKLYQEQYLKLVPVDSKQLFWIELLFKLLNYLIIGIIYE